MMWNPERSERLLEARAQTNTSSLLDSSLSPLQSNTNRHVQVHTRTHTRRNPSQDHLANSVVRGTYEQAVSHMNISYWGWTGWLKRWCLQTVPLELWCLIMFANIFEVIFFSSGRIYHNVSWNACQHPLFFAIPMKQSNFWHNQSLTQPRHELHLREAESAISEALCVGIMFS